MRSSFEHCCHLVHRAGADPLDRVTGRDLHSSKAGQQGIGNKHDQGTAQQGAAASHTHHPTDARMIFPLYTKFSKMGCPLDLHGRIIYLHYSLAFFLPIKIE